MADPSGITLTQNDPPLATGGLTDDVAYLPPPEKLQGKKLTAARTWLRFDGKGNPQWVKADKHAIQHQLGVPMRDLRLLEPKKSVASATAILARDKALVVSLEHVRAIICCDQVLLLNADHEDVKAIVPEMQHRLAGVPPPTPYIENGLIPIPPPTQATPARRNAQTVADITASVKNIFSKTKSAGNLMGVAGSSHPSLTGLGQDGTRTEGNATPVAGGQLGGPQQPILRRNNSLGADDMHLELPYELRALEVLLESVCTTVEKATADLESATHPALDAMTKKVTTNNLERVRKVKSRLTRLGGRVSKISDELERFLDDDSDMREMYLSRKAHERWVEKEKELRHRDSLGGGGGLRRGDSLMRRDSHGRGSGGAGGGGGGGGGGSEGGAGGTGDTVRSGEGNDIVDSDDEKDLKEVLREIEDDADVAEVEMLLETYFMMVDSISNRLNNLTEYVDNTEDYVNIDLDYHRNQLIQLELLLTTATFSITLVAVISGIFGMNIHNNIEDDFALFKTVTGVTSGLAILIFVVILAYCRYQRLMLV